MKKIRVVIIVASIIAIIVSFLSSKGEEVEHLTIPAGLGNDIELIGKDVIYKVPILVYYFQGENKISSDVLMGEGMTIAETRESRQLLSSKKYLLGLNRVFIFSENSVKLGLRSYIDINFNNPEVNDRALCVVCRGKSEDILRFKVEGYENTAEYIEGMIKNLKDYNFFSMQYKLMDLMVRVDAQGRNLLLPYIEIVEDNIKTTGLAIFNSDKMVAKTDMSEARVINILKESNVTGVLTLQKNSKDIINAQIKSKRKVKCLKQDGKYKFIINLNITADILSNELYKKINVDIKEVRAFEKDLKSYIEKEFQSKINEIYQKYHIDVLDLGRYAIAKYGRGKGENWNNIITGSDITVKAKVKLDRQGRGDY
ncbi:Ger(x)C family spore germination protein [Clostridium sp. 19966]|uniref:Ger(x)C family spore germination protein n=1 Tax=Clostridium sp. 19966 TaxID=2768166 RepID=UPI0028DDFF97|nr:Ger(x)C family spore germination protein [Clostridium sp. 19966]MDT8718545.1 Ger(x)C family spore germination protein [Clostridium sp. 19966]